jgi:hypothetical protein
VGLGETVGEGVGSGLGVGVEPGVGAGGGSLACAADGGAEAGAIDDWEAPGGAGADIAAGGVTGAPGPTDGDPLASAQPPMASRVASATRMVRRDRLDLMGR